MSLFDKAKKVIKSLRFKIVVIILVAGILPATCLSVLIVKHYEDIIINERIERMQNASMLLKTEIVTSGYINSGKSELVEAEIYRLVSGYGGRIMVINQDFVIIRDSYNMDEGKICVYDKVIRCFKGENITEYNESEQSIEIVVSLIGSQNVGGVLLMDIPAEDIAQNIEEVRNNTGVILIIIYLLVISVAAVFGMMVVIPFKKMTRHIRDIESGKKKEGNLDAGYTEMQDINDSVEDVISRLQELNESREEFVSNVSHELKTPITSIKVLADSLNMQENVPVEMYKEFMQDIAVEIDRESSIINDLLALMRMNKQATELTVSNVNITEIVEMVIKRVRPIAAKKNVQIVFESFKPVSAEVDEVKITMAITNLIENAVKYNVDDGWVNVSLNVDLSYFYLKVSDGGIGIPEDAQKQIFDRFYRVDKARSRETGGTGLGLAITQSVIHMHKGEIKLYSRENEGSTFNVRIPLRYVP